MNGSCFAQTAVNIALVIIYQYHFFLLKKSLTINFGTTFALINKFKTISIKLDNVSKNLMYQFEAIRLKFEK